MINPIPKPKKKKRAAIHKTTAKRTVVDGESYPSQLEANLGVQLKFEKLAGVVSDYQRQPTVFLTAAQISYKPDYRVWDSKGDVHYAEAKGIECERFRLIKKLWKYYGPAPLRIYKDAGRGTIRLVETIRPGGEDD